MMAITIEKKRKEVVTDLLKDMKKTAADMRTLIVGMPPEELLGYIYAQRLMKNMAGSDEPPTEHDSNGPDDSINEIQFLLVV